MEKKMFSSRLFWDSFKQLRIIGIMATVILSAFAAIIPVAEYLNNFKRLEIVNGVEKFIYSTKVVSALDIQPLMILTYTVIAPLLVLYIFNFLNKRSSSDFYHSIPETRSCLFLSMLTACVAWIVVMLISGTAISLITTGILHNYFIVNYTTVFVSLFTVFCANILVISAVAAAMSITGTAFNNVFVSGMLLFVPRIFVLALSSLVTGSVPYLSENSLNNGLLSPTLNMAFGTVVAFFSGQGFLEMLYSFSSGIYSLVLGLLFAALALFCFNRRKSEVAGNAAASKVLSAVYRITLAGVLSLIPCTFVFTLIVDKTVLTADTVFLIFVYYFIVALAYALYELISSKRLSTMVRSLPGLLYVALLNGLILLAIFGYRGFLLNFVPKSKDVTSIQLINAQDDTTRSDNYILDQAAEIKITDQKAIKIVSDSLAKAAKLYEKNKEDFNLFYHNSNKRPLVFKLNTKNFSGVRRIALTEEEYNYFMEVLGKKSEFRALFYNLPEKNISVTYSHYGPTEVQLTNTEARKLYARYLQDCKDIPLEDQIANVSAAREKSTGAFTLEFSKGFRKYTLELQVTSAHKRVNEFFNEWFYESNKENRAAVISYIRNMKNAKDFETIFVAPINVKNAEGNSAIDFNHNYNLSETEIAELAKRLSNYLESCPDQATTESNAFLEVSVYSKMIYEKYEGEMAGENLYYRFALPHDRLPADLEPYFNFDTIK